MTLTYTHPCIAFMITQLRVGMETLPLPRWSDKEIAEHFHLPSDHQLLNGNWRPVALDQYDTHAIPRGLSSLSPVIWAPGAGRTEFMYVLGYETSSPAPMFHFRFIID